MKNIAKITCAAVVSAGLAMAVAQAQAAPKSKMVKCYGIAQKGKNDCGGAKAATGHACQGQAVKSRDKYDWLLLPKGLCKKLVGGSTKPGG